MANHALVTRRTLAATLAAAIPAAAVSGPSLVSDDWGDDAELLELGRQLDAAVHEACSIRPAYDAAADAISAGMRDPKNERALRLANPEHGADGFAMVYRRLFGEHDKIIAHGNELMEAADLLAGEIAKHPPRTIVGVGVHARALAWFIADAWDGPIEDIDWDKARAQRFVETVCALAGASPLPDLLAA